MAWTTRLIVSFPVKGKSFEFSNLTFFPSQFMKFFTKSSLISINESRSSELVRKLFDSKLRFFFSFFNITATTQKTNIKFFV